MDEFIKDLKKFKENLKEEEKEIKRIISETMVQRIGNRMQEGLGTETWGVASKPYKKLKDSTVKKRSKNLKLSPKTTPSTSNQIETGKMHDQLASKKKGKDYETGFFGDRAKVAKIQEDNGRATLFLNKEDLEIIDDILDEQVDNLLKKTFG